MARVVLILPTATYRASDFVDAARRLGAEVVVASEEPQAMADAMGDRAVVVDLTSVDEAVSRIAELHARSPIDAVVAVDDAGVVPAARAAAALGLPHAPPEAAEATRDKVAMRAKLSEAGVSQPSWLTVPPGASPDGLSFPVVVKPIGLQASRGVIRADDPAELDAAVARVRRILESAGCDPAETLLVEEYVPGEEVAVEALARGGDIEILAVFDKPDPLTGPYFEETIYVTPSRHPEAVLGRVEALVRQGARALGLTEGPIHAEVRIDGERAWLIELASRTIGGLCSRTLTFGLGVTLEELVLRHALGRPTGRITRERTASGVMMLPIPRSGVLEAVGGVHQARAVEGIVGLEITVSPGSRVAALPEGDRYLGFMFAKAQTPQDVESALRTAHAALDVLIRP